jgi:hypothetical protein
MSPAPPPSREVERLAKKPAATLSSLPAAKCILLTRPPLPVQCWAQRLWCIQEPAMRHLQGARSSSRQRSPDNGKNLQTVSGEDAFRSYGRRGRGILQGGTVTSSRHSRLGVLSSQEAGRA